MKDEIIAGIKNALERGYTLEEATQSFINAGYNALEVKEAGSIFSAGATALTSIQSRISIPQQSAIKIFTPEMAQAPKADTMITLQDKKKPRMSKNVLLAIILCVMLAGVLGTIAYLLFSGYGK